MLPMSFTLTDEKGGRPSKTGTAPTILPPGLVEAFEAGLGIDSLRLYADLLQKLQHGDELAFRSLAKAAEGLGLDRVTLSRAFTQLCQRGLLTIDGGDDLKSAEFVRVNTFGAGR